MSARIKILLKSITLLLLVSITLIGCVGRITEALSGAMLNLNDPDIVRDGMPSYILMAEGLVLNDPDDEDKLLAASKLYSAYLSAFVDDPKRSKRLSKRAYDYAKRSICEQMEQVCIASNSSLDAYEKALQEIDDKDDLPYLFGFAQAWAGWVQAHSSDWNALADLPKIEATIRKVIQIDDRYDNGNAQLYMGVLNTLRPPSLGGKPEIGRQYFEQAISIAEERNLMAKLLFAKHYARLVFDRELHDKLLNEVINASVEAPGLTLINTIAKEQAAILLSESNDYF